MRKCIIALIAVCFLLMPIFTAYADLLIEPENDFYAQHRNQIIYLGRSFLANGANGFTTVKKEPGSKNEIAKLHNGEVTYVQYSCLFNGEFWGILTHVGTSSNGKTGWVRLDEMLVLYDYVAFEEDHFNEIYYYNGDYNEIQENRSAIAWPWPGADAPLWTFEDLDMNSFRASYAYKDNEGREWGFVTYLFGSRNVWFCLSDPLNRDMPVFNPAPEPSVWESETVHIDIRQQIDTQEKESLMLLIIIVLIVALVIGTAVLIKVFLKKDKTAGSERR